MAGGGAADDKSRWLITYGDLMTLMFALFVVMYGISTADIAKFQKFKEGLGDFGNPAARDAGVLSGGGGVAGDNPPGALSEQDYGPGPREEEVVGESRAGLGQGEGQGSDWRGVHFATRDELPFIRAELERALRRLGLRGEVSFRLEEEGLVTAVATDRVLFRSGSAVISPYGREIIAAIAPTLARLSNQVLIEGHTDNVPLNDPGYNNWNLSTDRAVAVVRLLQEAFGIDPGRLVAAGYGEYRPRATNETPHGRSVNRRVELVISTEVVTETDAVTEIPVTEIPDAPATGVPAAEDEPRSAPTEPVEGTEPDGTATEGETDEEVDGG